MDLQVAKSRLEEALAEIDSSAGTIEGEHADESSELTTVDQHPADSATQVSDVDRENAMLEGLASRRAEMVAALGRIEDGSYGTCVVCGKPIAEERLEAIPEASRCLDDQAAAESGDAG